MRERPQPDREKSAGRPAQGPAPPERKKKTGYYQKMSRNTEDAPAMNKVLQWDGKRPQKNGGPYSRTARRNRGGCASLPATS